eukprot:TRINITY_DN23923_c0_g1_i1.p1 TRINITY_DN23923_c0_g1~~TRINITY_DN23923_c0_g1_i1.p1  ORF type:complete len:341 (-),score=56.94 TRINITY_DN23923_c0_g1_i1:231-1253(-)
MDFGDLQLQLDTEAQDVHQNESWAVSEDGSLRHCATGIQIGERGLMDGTTSFPVNSADIEVDNSNLLGRGAGGTVVRGVHKQSGMPLAVKVVRVEDKAKRYQLLNDLRLLLRISKSAFLIQLYAAYVHKDSGCVHVALEYMDYGSLQDLRKKVKMVPENMLALVIIQILEGLKVLHLNYFVHRDVKLGNVLVNSKGCVKVTDFGISKKLDESDIVCGTFVGTGTHMSPERILGEDYTFPADVWSLGLCVMELASGQYPYGNVSAFPVLFDNLCNKPEPRLPAGRFTEALCNFVLKCLKRKPGDRATVIELQAHEFILSNITQVTQGDLVTWLNRVMRDED